MKKLIIASLVAACAVPFASAATLYNTMDPSADYGYIGDLSPAATYNVADSHLVVDDVNFTQNVNITSFSCRVLGYGGRPVGDTVSGYLSILNTVSGLPFGYALNGLYDFQITDISQSSDADFSFSIDLLQPLSQNLTAGTYWFGVELISNGAVYNIAGNHYATRESDYGFDGGYSNTMVKNGTWSQWYAPGTQIGTDLSMKIEGDVLNEPSVPGPAAILPFGIGLAAAIRRRRK